MYKLQFSFILCIVGNLKAACAAVASYLLFLPADETMLHNKDYYSFQPKVTEEYFTPREVCKKMELLKVQASRINDIYLIPIKFPRKYLNLHMRWKDS